MRFNTRILWILLFFLATYAWMVLFEHGVSSQRYWQGFKTEWRNVGSLLAGKPPGPVQVDLPASQAPAKK